MPRNMMDAQEAANYLHISYWTLLNRAKKGQVPCVKVGRRVLLARKAWINGSLTKKLKASSRSLSLNMADFARLRVKEVNA